MRRRWRPRLSSERPANIFRDSESEREEKSVEEESGSPGAQPREVWGTRDETRMRRLGAGGGGGRERPTLPTPDELSTLSVSPLDLSFSAAAALMRSKPRNTQMLTLVNPCWPWIRARVSKSQARPGARIKYSLRSTATSIVHEITDIGPVSHASTSARRSSWARYCRVHHTRSESTF